MINGTTYRRLKGFARRARPIRLTPETAYWCHYHQNYHHRNDFNFNNGAPRCRQYQREYYQKKKAAKPTADSGQRAVNSPTYTSPLDVEKICLKCAQPYTLRDAKTHRLQCGISKEVPKDLLTQTIDIETILGEDLEPKPKGARKKIPANGWRPGWLKGKHP